MGCDDRSSLAGILFVRKSLGTYDLLTLHDIGDQLSRRSIYIHLPRYNAEFTEDRKIWESVVWNFQCNIPMPEIPNFIEIWSYLYERSLGCVGILKNWTRNALSDALEENATTITPKHLERRALSIGQCRNILKKIKEGEKRYFEIEGEVEQLRADLGLSDPPVSRASKVSKTPSHETSTSPQKINRNVGRRKPIRDKVGQDQEVI